MKKLSLALLLVIVSCQLNAQNEKEQQQLKNVVMKAYESVSFPTRQWFLDAAEKHPAGDFDSSYAKQKLNQKFNKVQLASMGDIFVVMMAYMKMATKEAREDRQLKAAMNKRILASKAEKLKQDNDAIDQGLQEAREKAERTMDAAVTSLIIGIVSGNIQIAAAGISGAGYQKLPTVKDSTKSRTKIIPVTQHNKKLSLPLYIKKLETQLTMLKKGQY